jgi:hypothetical protein
MSLIEASRPSSLLAKARSLFGRNGSQYGYPGTSLRLPRPRAMSEMGVSGVAIFGGYIRSIERSPKWQGQERYRTATEIASNVSIVAASLHYFLNLIAHPEWHVAPADENDDEAKQLAEFVEQVMAETDTPWPRIVRRAALYRFHGFGIQEWIAKKRKDGLIGLRDIEPRPQFTIERWELDDTGAVTGMWQRSPQTGRLLGLPRQKVVYLVDDAISDSPEGLGIFRHLAEPYERLKTYLELEARCFERDLRGTPIARAPLTLLNKAVENGEITKEKAQEMVRDLHDFVKLQVKQSDTGMVLDSMPYESAAADGPKVAGIPQWNLDILTGSANGLAELGQAIDRLQREMARIIGTEHLMMGDQGGNRALAVDKSRNLYLIANSVLGNIASAFRNDLVNPLWLLNGWPEETKPYLKTEDVAFKDVGQITAALRDMATAGAVLSPDDPAIGDVRDLLGIERPLAIERENLGEIKTRRGERGEGGNELLAEDKGGPTYGVEASETVGAS